MGNATVVIADELSVTRNGGALFDDSFSQNTNLAGGNGTIVSSGVNFSGGGTANYFVHGTISETTANNGQATLNSATGTVVTQPPPFIPAVQYTSAFLQTGTLASNLHALTSSNTFTATGLFDLSVPSVALGTYHLGLTNRYTSNNLMGNQLQLRMRNCVPGVGLCGAASGPVLQFFWGDFINNTDALIAQVSLTAAQLSNPQIEFELTKPSGSSDVIDAFYAVGSGNTLGTFNGTLTSLGSTDGSTDVFTASLDTVLVGIEAFQPVPEPASLTLLGTALVGFSLIRRRKRKHA